MTHTDQALKVAYESLDELETMTGTGRLSEQGLNATYAPKESAVTVVRDGDDVTLYDSNGVEL
ncbi:hypothetical protein A6411_10675 [Prescottella equi]|nr:hypothetical protein A6411_10675 [Prescottella equi]